MLYTVRPLERIYKDFHITEEDGNKDKGNNISDDYKEVELPHGRIVTRKDGKDYIVEKINSTDMSDYLNGEYTPGSIVNK